LGLCLSSVCEYHTGNGWEKGKGEEENLSGRILFAVDQIGESEEVVAADVHAAVKRQIKLYMLDNSVGYEIGYIETEISRKQRHQFCI
jgi:hypothetical protein